MLGALCESRPSASSISDQQQALVYLTHIQLWTKVDTCNLHKRVNMSYSLDFLMIQHVMCVNLSFYHNTRYFPWNIAFKAEAFCAPWRHWTARWHDNHHHLTHSVVMATGMSALQTFWNNTLTQLIPPTLSVNVWVSLRCQCTSEASNIHLCSKIYTIPSSSEKKYMHQIRAHLCSLNTDLITFPNRNSNTAHLFNFS